MTTYLPGDILLVRDYTGGSDLLGNLILAGQRARYGNSDVARWTHSALIVSAEGDIVEALAEGVRRTNISKYAQTETLIISPKQATQEARALVVEGALGDVGLEYNKIDFVSLAIKLLTRINWGVNDGRADICSELCARYTEKYIPQYQYKSYDMMPADLGSYYGAISGAPLPPLSFFGRFLDKFRAIMWTLQPWRTGIRGTK